MLTTLPAFGLELEIKNLSVYGVRELCKGRSLTFKSNYDGRTEDKKFCGKLEEYSDEEKVITFPAQGNHSETTTNDTIISDPKNNNNSDDSTTTTPGIGNASTSSAMSDLLSVNISIHLPKSVKSRETFSLLVSTLSPCQKVLLRQFDGVFQYSRNGVSDECSVRIHVPYGNTIVTQVTVSDAVQSSSAKKTSDDNANYEDDNNTITNARGEEDSIHNGTSSLFKDDDSLFTYNEGESHCSSGALGIQELRTVLNFSDQRYLLVQAKDLTSGSKFTWCFDPQSSNIDRKRAWKSTGNKVELTFSLSNFQQFKLTYKAVRIPEIVGSCENGWVTLNPQGKNCVSVVEEERTWEEAEEVCQSRGAHLVTLRDHETDLKVQKLIRER